MDSIFHATRKIMIERAATTSTTRQRCEIPETAPPAYSADPPTYIESTVGHETDSDLDSHCDEYNDDDDDDDDNNNKDPSPVTLTLNAQTQVHGTGNLIGAVALADATRFSALLLAAVQSLNAKAEAEAQLVVADDDDGVDRAREGGQERARVRVRPTLNVRLVLDCGISITGDRNVVGYRPSAVVQATTAAAGAKRSAGEELEGAPPSKKCGSNE